jgi:hypothetical protein
MGEDPGGRGAGRDGSAEQGGAGIDERGSADEDAVAPSTGGNVQASTAAQVEAWIRQLPPRRRPRPAGGGPSSKRARRTSLGLVALVAVLLLSACQPGGWVARMIDPSGKPVTHACGAIPWGVQSANPGDPTFRLNVVSVIWQIQQLTGRQFTEVPYAQGHIQVTESWPATNTHPGYTSVRSDGWHFTVNTVYINPKATVPNSLLRMGVMRHEIGHAMGLDHTAADPSIMNPARYRNDYSAEVDIPGLRYLATHC